MNDWRNWVIGLETTMLGFFVWAFFAEALQIRRDVRELMTDKSLRDNDKTQKP